MRNPFRRRYTVRCHGLTALGDLAPETDDNPTLMGRTRTRRGAENIRKRYPPMEPIPGKPLWTIRIEND